ncbi:hypothetical protein [Pseudomonas nitroreducens]|uniref:hypothetical protein n=1 Tax=Pseudomonas nitroreducens TaxID=46680 RepID=UPI00351D4EF4
MTTSNRFPSGASTEQVKKDAKKLAKANSIPLHEALDRAAAEHGAPVPWNRVQEYLASQDNEELLALFTLPLSAGGDFFVSITVQRPLISVTGVVAVGKSISAMLIAEQFLAQTRGRVHLVSAYDLPADNDRVASESSWGHVWNRLKSEYGNRCLQVSSIGRPGELLPGEALDLTSTRPDRGDLVIVDERNYGARGQSFEEIASVARMWRVGVVLCKIGGPWNGEITREPADGGPFTVHVECFRAPRTEETTLLVTELLTRKRGSCRVVPGADFGSPARRFRFDRSTPQKIGDSPVTRSQTNTRSTH